MRRDQAVGVLRAHLAEIRRFSVRSISLFGSVARDDAGPDSDVDVLVEFSATPGLRGFMGLKFFLEELLGRPVDLVTNAALKPRTRALVERDLLPVA